MIFARGEERDNPFLERRDRAAAVTPGNRSASETSDEELLRIFIGPNAEKYLELYRAQQEKKGKLSFNWAVFLAVLPWFFYRKLYLLGFAVVFVPLIVFLIFPSLGEVGPSGYLGALGFFVNMMYVGIATRRVEKLKALDLPRAELEERLRKSGGTSPGGAVFGCLIVASIFALIFIEGAKAELPGCDNAQVHELAEGIALGGASNDAAEGGATEFSDFKPVESTKEDARNLCSFTAVRDGESTVLYLSVTWKDTASGEFLVTVGPTLESVSG